MDSAKTPFHQKKPLVRTDYLLLLSGLVWSLVGIKLILLAYNWQIELAQPIKIYVDIGGTILAILVYVLMFKFVADKNIHRLLDMPDKINFFAFQEFKSYLIIIVMISLGIFLRTSGFFPMSLLAFSYFGIGGGLFLGSTNYYHHLITYDLEDD